MVVAYPSGSVGSALSFFTTTPVIIFWRTGSVIPNIIPQIVIVALISIVCVAFRNPLTLFIEEDEIGTQFLSAMSSVGFLLAFLLVNKTMNGQGEFDKALSHLNQINAGIRDIARIACICQTQSESKEGMLLMTKLLRYLLLYVYVITEYFQRTGENATDKKEDKDFLRDAIRRISIPEEMLLMYPLDKDPRCPGSESEHAYTNPRIMLFWVQLTIEHFMKTCEEYAPHSSSFMTGPCFQLALNFWEMNMIDKTQFPLPYAQVLKILLVVYILACPLCLAPVCGWGTPIVTTVMTIGYCGLDEVAEILDSPFGTDANDIDLIQYAQQLARDLDEMWDFVAKRHHEIILSGREKVYVEEGPDGSVNFFRNQGFSKTVLRSSRTSKFSAEYQEVKADSAAEKMAERSDARRCSAKGGADEVIYTRSQSRLVNADPILPSPVAQLAHCESNLPGQIL
eukprot:gnl/TRDRNA2_/TRDRNA2_171123_c0_seq1.p1 gnl/TRDRNA2_/TRDRNA2_171123_c0~~gnl/TRDRNA2_/TRDRNA2_171123_c0_seq1.p1  ORF type:complete len:454 (+),score=52.78 gnl/TRDRNA2_/TRDRNA2_171123_c0_seq1:46-1407(+)